MTQINRLTANVSVDPNDSFPLWSIEAGRTRRVTGQTLIDYITQENIKSAEFDSEGHLILTLNNGDTIDAGELPKAVLKIDDQPVGEIYTEGSINALIEDGVATFSVNNSVTLWPIHEVGIGDSPFVIDSPDQLGIEYQYTASSQFTQSMHLNTVGLPDGAQVKVTVYGVEEDSKPIYVTQFRQGKDFTWPVSTPTVFTLRSGDWRVEESSQLLHIQNSTTFDDDAARKRIIHGVAVDPNSSITMTVNDDGVLVVGGGSDTPTPDDTYIKKYTRAETEYVQIAYQGKYGDERVYYPSTLRQDVNGWTQFEYTGNLQFKPRDKSTGELGDTTLRIGAARSDFYHPLYVEGKRAAERTSHHIYNTYSLNDLITSNSESFVEWMANNPDYTQVQFLNTLFSCTVLGSANWVVSATTSGEDYNGTFPNGYQQIEIHRNGGGSRSFLRAYNKESPTHYFANYKANTELDWKQYAYADDSVDLKDKISYDNEIQNLNTTGSGVFVEYLGFGSTSAEHTHTFDESGVFWISNLQSSTRNKLVNVISSNGAELTGISVPFNRVVKFTYSSEIEEIITEASYANVDLDSSPADSTFDGEGFGVPSSSDVSTGVVTQDEITGNWKNNSAEAGDLTINLLSTNGVNNWRFYYTFPASALSSRNLIVQVDNKPSTTKQVRSGESWLCEVKGGRFYDDFFWQKIIDNQSTFDAIDTSGFDSFSPEIKTLKKSFTDKDLISIPVELPDDMQIFVSSVICNVNGRLRKQPFEYQYENGILRVHLNEVCSGIIIAEMIK